MAAGCGGGSCFWTCFIGCGVITLLLVIVIAVLAFFAVRFLKENVANDPATANLWLQEILPSKLPDGYQAQIAIRVPFLNVRFVTVMPHGLQAPQGNAAAQGFTMFFVVSAPGMDEDQLRSQLEAQQNIHLPHRSEKTEAIEIKAGRKSFKATKAEGTDENGRRFVMYQLMPLPNVLLLGLGPIDQFDQTAFESFLASVEPPSVPQSEKVEVKEKNAARDAVDD